MRNDVISYSMTATTSCPYSINLEWNGSGEYAGGIVIVGDLFSPVVEVTVDDARLAHINSLRLLRIRRS